MKRLMICLILSMFIITGCATDKKEESGTEEQGEEVMEESLVKSVDLNGKEMEYIRFGNQEGDVLVILPGLSLKSVMGSAEAIAGAYGLLSADHEIYLFDHIKKEPEGYSIEDMAEDTIKAFESLGLEHIHLMGVSMGGMVSQVIALKRPELVDSLILCSTTSNVKDLDPEVFETWKKLGEEKDAKALMASFGEKVYSPSFYEQYKDIILAGAEGVTDEDFSNFLVSVNAISAFDVYDQLDQIQCPVLVLGAGEDQVVGVKSSLNIVEKLQCDYFIYEGYGHGVYDEAPDYQSHIKEFLDKK